MKLRSVHGLALALFTLAACVTAPPRGEPAASAPVGPRAFAWELRRADRSAPIYVLGSIHIGGPDQFKLPGSVQSAFEAADALVVEADTDTVDAAAVQQLTLQHGVYPPDQGLMTELSKETQELLVPALERVSLDLRKANRIRPWLLFTMLSVMELQRAGYTPDGGIDQLLLRQARGKKEILELESVESQIEMLASLPASAQEAMLKDHALQVDLYSVVFANLASAWEGGNADAVADLVFKHADAPEMKQMFDLVYFDRNERMAQKIDALAASGKRLFVVVGAGHLAGPRGVQRLLAQRGYSVRQLERN